MLASTATRTHLSSLSSSYPSYNKAYLRRDNPEFDFWATAETNRSLRSFLSPGSHGDEEEEEEEVDDDHHYEELEAELCFPLQKHQARSSLSNLQAIAEGRKQLMELAGEMLESNLELSLKDIVNERTVSPSRAITEGDHVGVVKGGSFHFATEKLSSRRNDSMQQKKKNAVINPCFVPRSYSIDKGTFLIKMFSPSTRSSWKTNLKSSSSLKEGCAVRSSSNRCGSSRTTSRSSSCSSSGFSSSSTTRCFALSFGDFLVRASLYHSTVVELCSIGWLVRLVG
ncbi:unnamed protein product [Linum tenue]|uniref:Uncharacterized protein n=1 Tax=Linum tenue TaxID=586396 RepID=A0AAV0RE87_9ROSI|nr:unnamed protein product [Linum tenue]